GGAGGVRAGRPGPAARGAGGGGGGRVAGGAGPSRFCGGGTGRAGRSTSRTRTGGSPRADLPACDHLVFGGTASRLGGGAGCVRRTTPRRGGGRRLVGRRQPRQVPQRGDAGQEEVAAATHPDEPRHLGIVAAHRAGRDGEVAAVRRAAADDRVGVPVQAVERGVVHPAVLDELELPGQVAGQAQEVQAALPARGGRVAGIAGAAGAGRTVRGAGAVRVVRAAWAAGGAGVGNAVGVGRAVAAAAAQQPVPVV